MEHNPAFYREIQRATDALRSGAVVAYPTDTVWGLGCDAANMQAINKLYSLKERPVDKAMLVLVSSGVMLEHIVGPVSESLMRLMTGSRRPVTVIFPHARNVAPNLLATDGSLGVRITNEAFSNALCESLGHPLVSTSANFSGMPSPSSFQEIDPRLLQRLEYVANYGQDLPPALPSMIVKLMPDGMLNVVRP